MHRTSLAVLVLLACTALPAQAGGSALFGTTNIQYLYGTTYADFNEDFSGFTDDDEASVITIEHFNVWKYGDTFLFVDITNGEREGDVAIGGVGEGDHAVAARLVLGPVVPLVLQGEGAGVLEGDAVAVAESVGGIPVAERGVVTDDPDVGGGALQLELDANVRGDFHGPSAPAWGLHMGVP